MIQKMYYLDTCIWLNLFKKEGDSSKGIPYWKITEEFIKKIEQSNEKIIVSSIILKELSYVLFDKYFLVKEYFKDKNYIKLIKTKPEDYELARKLENKYNFEISFYDYLHIAIAKRLNVPLITRDKDLLNTAKKLINANKPEELIY